MKKIWKLEKTSIEHYEQLKNDMRKSMIHPDNIEIKILEIEKLKLETSLKKWEVYANITGILKNVSKWVDIIFGKSC